MDDEVQLRDVREDDLPILFEHQLDPEALRMAAFPSRDRAAFDAHWGRLLADPTVTAQAVVAGGRVAGYALVFRRGGDTLVGYWLGREHWGRGVATRAVARLLERVTDRPLRAHVARHNVGSRRVLAKCGFRVIGERTSVEPDGDVEEVLFELT